MVERLFRILKVTGSIPVISNVTFLFFYTGPGEETIIIFQ